MSERTFEERLDAHRKQSREYAEHSPGSYVSGYPNMLIDEENKVVVMTPEDVRRLDEYSRTVPTGVYVDKCWLWRRPEYGDRLDDDAQLVLRVYRETDPPNAEMNIVSYTILVAR